MEGSDKVNPWVERSIFTANAPGYLDRLHAVYPVTRELKREIPHRIVESVREAFERRDDLTLLRILLRLSKFPVKDPYVAFLRKRDTFLDYNPKTVQRIVSELYSIGLRGVLAGLQEPKEFNRQIGTFFRRWLSTLGYPFLEESEFSAPTGKIAFLAGGNGVLLRYANTVLGCRLTKGPDLLARVGSLYVLGEAKFLTDYGGHQNAQFADALSTLLDETGTAVRIAVLDGVVWIKDSSKMYRTLCTLRKPALSALLLKDFLEDLLSS